MSVYSQKDGWWADKAYRESNLQKSGCAVFTLSSALYRLGVTGEDMLPDQLAITYAQCLTSTGTNNERLLREAGKVYNFKTQSELIESQKKIVSLLGEGCLFSFAIVRGHIALADGASADGKYIHVADSAPSATLERIKGASLYVLQEDGKMTAVESLTEIPGARWYLDTEDFGGLEYYLPLSYVARRGVRLIRPLTESAEN